MANYKKGKPPRKKRLIKLDAGWMEPRDLKLKAQHKSYNQAEILRQVDREYGQPTYDDRYMECKACNASRLHTYIDEIDAHMCLYCGELLEEKCSDPDCEFCKGRW